MCVCVCVCVCVCLNDMTQCVSSASIHTDDINIQPIDEQQETVENVQREETEHE